MFHHDVNNHKTIGPLSRRHHFESVEGSMYVECLEEYVQLVLLLLCKSTKSRPVGVNWVPFDRACGVGEWWKIMQIVLKAMQII